MSGEAGEGSPGGGVEVMDFHNRIKRFQQQDQQLHQQQVGEQRGEGGVGPFNSSLSTRPPYT